MFQQRMYTSNSYESQAQKWKQGFRPPTATSHRHTDMEAALIGELCTSAGSSSFPPRDAMNKLKQYLSSLDHEYMCELLTEKLAHSLWQVQGKAVAVLDFILRSPHASLYTDFFASQLHFVEPLCYSSKSVLSARAKKVYNQLNMHAPPPSQSTPSHPQEHHESERDEPLLPESSQAPVETGSSDDMPDMLSLGDLNPTPGSSPVFGSQGPAAVGFNDPPPMSGSGFDFLSKAPSPPLSPPNNFNKLEETIKQQQMSAGAHNTAFISNAAPMPPTSGPPTFDLIPVNASPPRPVDVFDTLPPATLTITGHEENRTSEKQVEEVDPIHDAFEGMSISDQSEYPWDAYSHLNGASDSMASYPESNGAITGPLREVLLEAEIPPGPMGVVFDRTIKDMVVVERFVPLPTGESGYLAMHPAIGPGCALLSVNHVSTEDKGLDEVGPILQQFVAEPKQLRFKKLMNNGRVANPSTLAMPYVPPPPEVPDGNQEDSSVHMAKLQEYDDELDKIETELSDLIRREQLNLPVVDRRNTLAQMHGTVERIQTQGIDAIIIGPNPPPNVDEVKQFRSSLVHRADALTKRIQRTAKGETTVAQPEPNVEPETSSAFSFLSNAPKSSEALDESTSSGFAFMQQQRQSVDSDKSAFSFVQNEQSQDPFAGLRVHNPSSLPTYSPQNSIGGESPVDFSKSAFSFLTPGAAPVTEAPSSPTAFGFLRNEAAVDPTTVSNGKIH